MGWWERYLRWRRRHVGSLHLLPGGFALRHGDRSAEMRWDAIRDVMAFKRDLVTVDLLCLMVRDDAAAIELDEGMAGYAAFERAMHLHLGIAADWKLEVLFPAFATQARMLFRDGLALPPGGAAIGA